MKFIKNNFWTICSWAFVLTLIAADSFASAGGAGSSLMTTAQTKMIHIFSSVKTITFIIGGFGLVGIAYQAAIGKVNWKWFAGLAVGLALLAAAGAIIEYATGDTGFSGTDAHTGLDDSFSDGQSY
ncbi:MAG: TrbC/VirB2 family protein [Alphaproteobacteria bacterium]|nr:TrbC/VirB2 family protein [Alphaproteobacteria bacterium]